jgi:tetratricopeptide (TPR) repeat protein
MRPRSYEVSDSLYRRALDIDSTYAPAWVGLSSNYVNEISFGSMQSAEGFRLSRHAALKALTYDPGSGLAHSRLGIVEMWSDDDLGAAAKSFERALTLDPNDATLLMNTAQFLVTIGRPRDAIAVLKTAVALDPVNVNVIANLGGIQVCTGEFDEGVANMRTALALSPSQAVLHYQIGLALVEKGDAVGGLAEIEKEHEEFRRIGLPFAYHALGRKADADSALADLIAKDGDASAYNVANAYAFRGDKDPAFKWLERAQELHDPGLASVTFDTLFDNLHSDPRWPVFLRKIGKAPEQLEKIEFRLPGGIVQ